MKKIGFQPQKSGRAKNRPCPQGLKSGRPLPALPKRLRRLWCEYCQRRQSCKAFTSLSIRAKMVRGVRSLLRENLAETDQPPSKRWCGAPRRSKLQEAAASTEQRSSDRSRSTKTIPRHSVAKDVTLTARFSRGSITKWLC